MGAKSWLSYIPVVDVHIGGEEWVVDGALTVDEVQALLLYVANYGIEGVDCSLAKSLYIALNNYLEKKADPQAKAEELTNLSAEVFSAYCAIARSTYKAGRVNGRTVRDSTRPLRSLGWVLTTTIGFFLLVLVTQFYGPILDSLENNYFEDPSLTRTLLEVIGNQIIPYIEPFFWGGLGACIFLLKSYNDKMAGMALDTTRLPGYSARIALGAILAVVVVNVFYSPLPSAQSGGAIVVTKDAVAFLVGLGVRVIYGAFEKLVDTLSNQIEQWGKGSAKTP